MASPIAGCYRCYTIRLLLQPAIPIMSFALPLLQLPLLPLPSIHGVQPEYRPNHIQFTVICYASTCARTILLALVLWGGSRPASRRAARAVGIGRRTLGSGAAIVGSFRVVAVVQWLAREAQRGARVDSKLFERQRKRGAKNGGVYVAAFSHTLN
jgi:hypothetical protein